MNKRIKTAGLGALGMLCGTLLLVGSSVSIAAPAAAPALQTAPTPTPLSLDELSLIQPGLGTVMVEYGHRMAAVWFAGEAGNWDLAQYQVIEMREIQETAEITRPARAPALKAFESNFLEPLQQATKDKDKAKFESAYNAAIQGCNSCHGSQTSPDWPQGFKFVKVQMPKDTLESIYSYTP
jgi:hypothetical protein